MNRKRSRNRDYTWQDIRFSENDASWNWEARLRPQVRSVELLGEIPITAEECDQLGKAIGRIVESWGHGRGLHALTECRPATFAVYLVAQGLYGYEGGDYWTEVVQKTGFARARTSTVGQAFEEVLEQFDLPLFYDMRAEKAHRYVSLILAHGGIPTYCLDDFFSNMVQPAVRRAEYADMTAAELIDEWQWRARAQYFTDKPVLRFLTYGGRVAEDFLDRCREMAHTYVETGDVPPAEELGLPERVVSAYLEWAAAQGQAQIEREERDQWRLRRPEIRVDPWGEGITFDLPPQQVPATFIQAEIGWRIRVGDRTMSVPVRVRRSGFDWATVLESVRLGMPAETYQAEFLVDGVAKRTWRFQGVDPDRPLFIFDAERLTALAWKLSLPAQCLGFMVPRDCALTVEGATSPAPRLLEELPRMRGGWSDFQGQIWEVSDGDRVRLSRDGQEILSAPVRADEVARRPALTGGDLTSEDPAGRRAPVYAGVPPSIRIPLAQRGSLAEELTRWRLSVRSNWAAAPELDVTTTLDDLQAYLERGEDEVELPLSLPELLGQHPVGTYTVQLRGPLGRSAAFKLRMLSHFVVCGHEALCLPEPGLGQPPVELLIETAPGDTLECRGRGNAEDEGVACKDTLIEESTEAWEYALAVPPEVTEVEITVVHQRSHGDPVRVPVHVPIRRLRWMWADEGQDRIARAWTGKAIRLPVEALLQAEAPALLVSLPLPETGDIQMALRLVDVDNQELMRWDAPKPRGHHRVWRVELAAFLDTIRASDSPALRVELLIGGLPDKLGAQGWYVLTLTRTLSIEDVHMKAQIDGDLIAARLTWREETRLCNRIVRLWSLWRPWQSVQTVRIPDDADGELRFRLPSAEFAPGGYRLQFLTEDPWTPEVNPQRPGEDDPGTLDVALTMPVARLRWLEDELSESSNPFPLWLERAHIGQAISDQRGSLQDIERCYQNLDGGTVPQILALRALTVEMKAESQRKALELRMFAPGRAMQLLYDYREGALLRETLDAYLACLPRSGLLPLETCRLLLDIDDERAQIYALRQLMRRGSPLGAETVHRWVQDARLSDADAVAILSLNSELGGDYLQKHWREPVARRLLEKLSRASGDMTRVIKAGVWVRTNVGWGIIDSIENTDGEAVAEMIRGQKNCVLRATLRPNVNPEPVVIDLTKMRVTFTEPGKIYTCRCEECEGFSTHDPYLIREGHNRAAHNGVGPAHRPEKFSFRTTQTVRYSARKPHSELA